MCDQELVAKFQSKILGIRNYKSNKKQFFVDDFLNMEVLTRFLTEVSNCESDITPAGKAFLDRYHGFEDVAAELARKGGFALTTRPSTPEEILDWLKDLQPMQTITFIEEARGNIEPGARLKTDLLPPEDA
jgi:hypothetical protein